MADSMSDMIAVDRLKLPFYGLAFQELERTVTSEAAGLDTVGASCLASVG